VVLHNHPDVVIMKALRSLIPAMKAGAKISILDHGLVDLGEGRSADEKYDRPLFFH